MLATQVSFRVNINQQNAHIRARQCGFTVFFTSSSKSDRTGLTGGGCIWNDIIDKDLDAQVGK